jgi:hypothetical protein
MFTLTRGIARGIWDEKVFPNMTPLVLRDFF